jgi:tetratricopeptide (TPR) repeat protein
MQDAAVGQKAGEKFNITQTDNQSSPRTKFFEIVPESEASRKNAIREFEIAQTENSTKKSGEHAEKVPEGSKHEATDGSRVAELLLNAETLVSHGEKHLARVLVYEALKIDSKNIAALKKSVQFLDAKKERAQIIHIQKQICNSDFSFESVSQLGHSYYLDGQDDQALSLYNAALSIVVDETTALFEVYKNVGNILTRSGDYDGAEEYFHKAYTLSPDSDVLLVNLGTLFVQRQDFASSLERFRLAVEKNPLNDKAWVGLALSHQQMGDFNLSIANIEKALDLNPFNRTAVHIYANWCVRDGKYLAAITAVEKFLGSVDLDEELSLVLVHLHCKTNQFALALLEAERVLLWNPQSTQMAHILSEIKTMSEQARSQFSGKLCA